MPKDPETLGERLALARKRLGFSQEALSTASGVPLGSIKKWEGGDSEPGSANLAKLAKIGIDLNWLVTGASYMTDATGKVFYPMPPPHQQHEGLAAMREMEAIANRIHEQTTTPDARPVAPEVKINAAALAVMLQAAQMAHPKASIARQASLAAEFYALSVAAGTVTADDIIPPEMDAAA